MLIEVKRHTLKPEYTVGKMFIDGIYYCDTIEDTVRDLDKDGDFDNGEEKIFSKTAIPYGTYNVGYTFSPKFKKNMAIIEHVEDFEGIRIHGVLPGVIALPKHTEGCILVGENKVVGGLVNSAFYQKDINQKIGEQKGEMRTVTIIIS